MKKLLKYGFFTTIASTGALSLSTAASAAVLFGNPPNQLSFNFLFNLEDLDLVRDGGGVLNAVLPTPSVVFQGGLLEIAGNGNLGDPFTPCNTGTITSLECSGTIQDFTVATGVVDPFITVTDTTGPVTLDYSLTIDTDSITDPLGISVLTFSDDGVPGGPSAASCVANPAQNGCSALIRFQANGKLTVIDSPTGVGVGDVVDIFYSYTGPRILVDGDTSTSCGANAGDTCTLQFLQTSSSANILAVQQAVPEPGSASAVLGLGVLGAVGIIKRKKKLS